jgi:hypothetical protein
MRTTPTLLLLASLAAASGATAAPDGAAAAALFDCPVPLAGARENLEARGYVVAPGATADAFTTAYRMSEKDSERRLLGSLAVERARQYRVTAVAGGIRFQARHRETVFATGVLGRRNDEVREYDLTPGEATQETLKDMRREVCTAAPGQAPAEAARPDPAIEQYVIERCKDGDERACKLLRLR